MIAPYKIGDRFKFLTSYPYEITAVIAKGDTFEYAAKYVGDRDLRYWRCDFYSHSSIRFINTLKS